MFFSVVPKGHPGSWTSRSWTHTRVGNGCDPQNWKSHRESSDSAWRLWTRGGRLSQSGANQASCVLWLIPESCFWPVLEQCPAFCFSLCASPCPCSHTGPSSAFPELLSGPALLSSGSSRSCILVAFPGALVSFVPGKGSLFGAVLPVVAHCAV